MSDAPATAMESAWRAALLSRAAIAEARRQSAEQRHDAAAVVDAERELAELREAFERSERTAPGSA